MKADGFRSPVTLRGRYVDLVPLAPEHADGLTAAGRDPEIWPYLLLTRPRGDEGMRGVIERRIRVRESGVDMPFTVVRKADGVPIGMTCYLDIDRENRNVEVGGTWYDSRYWRTPINSDAKRQILGHAFEVEGVVRVQLKTDLRNVRSQVAIERLGAVREGVLRQNRALPEGGYRDSVYYSILANEWPEVRTRLDRALARPWTDPNLATSSGSSVSVSR
jgi:N-acetyltransferase